MTSKVVIAVIGGAASIGLAIGVGVVIPSGPTYTTVSIPASYGGHTIASDCTSDATAGLNAFFASLTTPTVVNAATNGCYSVSPNAGDLLTVNGLTNIVVNGRGSTFYQPSYLKSDGVTTGCNTNTIAPVLEMWSDTNITVNDLTVKGPVGNGAGYDCQGSLSEGDNGIYIGNHTTNDGSSGLTFTGVTVENVNGDALDIYPDLSTNDTGINTNVVFQNGTLTNWGWYGIVPEGVNGLNLTGSTIGNANGRFLDAENDGTCDGVGGPTYAQCTSGPGGTPVGAAMWNMSIVNNTFTSNAEIDGQGPQGCIPQQNWTIAGNTYQGTAGVIVDGSYANTACPGASNGLTFSNNTASAPTSQVCGSGGTPAPCAALAVSGWTNVTIQNNTYPVYDGYAGEINATANDASLTSGSGTVTSATIGFQTAWGYNVSTPNKYLIVGPGLPTNDYLASVTNSTTATLNNAATANETNSSITVGQQEYGVNTPTIASVGLCGVVGATITNNTFNGGYQLDNTTTCKDPSTNVPTSGVSTCGNSWYLVAPVGYYNTNLTFVAAPAANPQTDSAC